MNPLLLLSGAGMMAVAVVAVVYWKIRSGILWRLFLWGALAWTVGVGLKAAAAAPMVMLIPALRNHLPKYASEPILWLYVGLLTGIFECGATLCFAYIRRIRTANWKQVVGFGLGFGAFEALLVGLASFVLVLAVVLIPDKLPAEMLEKAGSGSDSPLVIPAPIVERITAIFLHAFSCVLIVYAVRTKQWRWFWVAFWYKTAVDAIAGLMHLENLLQDISTLGTWVVEMIFLPFGIVGLWGLWVFHKRWESLDAQPKTSEDEDANKRE